MVMSPFYRVDTHSHRYGMIQGIYTGETQIDAPVVAILISIRLHIIHIPQDGVLVHEMCSVALKFKRQNNTS